MKHEHDIRRHSFIGNNDLLTAIDDEVAALVIPAFSCILHNFLFAHSREVAKLGSVHYRYLSNQIIVIFVDSFLIQHCLLTSLLIALPILQLLNLHRRVNVSLVG